MQEGKEGINKSVFKVMSGCLMKKGKKCGNTFIFYIYTIFYVLPLSYPTSPSGGEESRVYRNLLKEVKSWECCWPTWTVWRKTAEGEVWDPATCGRRCSSSSEQTLRPDWHFSPAGRETQCWPWSADPENIADLKIFSGRNGMEAMCRYHFVDNLTRDIFNQGNLISLQRPQFFPLVFCRDVEKQRRSVQ